MNSMAKWYSNRVWQKTERNIYENHRKPRNFTSTGRGHRYDPVDGYLEDLLLQDHVCAC
jgi:hypothetical protein